MGTQLVKMLNHTTIKIEIENISKNENSFKDITERYLRKIKSVKSKINALTTKKIFVETGVSL